MMVDYRKGSELEKFTNRRFELVSNVENKKKPKRITECSKCGTLCFSYSTEQGNNYFGSFYAGTIKYNVPIWGFYYLFSCKCGHRWQMGDNKKDRYY